VALGQISLRVLQFPLVIISFHNCSIQISPPHEVRNSSDQAALYHGYVLEAYRIFRVGSLHSSLLNWLNHSVRLAGRYRTLISNSNRTLVSSLIKKMVGRTLILTAECY
jgi:hypothetical protein